MIEEVLYLHDDDVFHASSFMLHTSDSWCFMQSMNMMMCFMMCFMLHTSDSYFMQSVFHTSRRSSMMMCFMMWFILHTEHDDASWSMMMCFILHTMMCFMMMMMMYECKALVFHEEWVWWVCFTSASWRVSDVNIISS